MRSPISSLLTTCKLSRASGIIRTLMLPIVVFLTALIPRLLALYLRYPLGPISFNSYYETYDDFYGYYVSWWLKSLQLGQVPYRDFFYQYPPLFLYSLYPAYYFVGALGAASIIILFDAGSAVIVYFIAKQSSTRKVAFLSGIGYALSPFAILYEGYVLYSMQPMLFFLLLSFFLFRARRLYSSVICLAISVLLKQQAMFIIPAFLVSLIQKRYFGLKSIGKATILSISVLLVVSLPFLVVSPIQYLSTIAYHPPPYTSTASSNNSTEGDVQTCLYFQEPSGLVAHCVHDGTTLRALVVPLAYQILNTIFSKGLPIMSLVPLPFLFMFRKKASFFALSSAYSFAVLVMLFAYFFSYAPLDKTARYPYLPVYAFLLFSGSGWEVPVAALAISSISLIIPPGVIQMVIPFLAIWVVMLVDRSGIDEQLAPKRV